MSGPMARPDAEVLAGLVERVTFHNEDNGFCVLRVKARGHRELVTVVGHAATISAGEWITATGEWVVDRTHGQQRALGEVFSEAGLALAPRAPPHARARAEPLPLDQGARSTLH